MLFHSTATDCNITPCKEKKKKKKKIPKTEPQCKTADVLTKTVVAFTLEEIRDRGEY